VFFEEGGVGSVVIDEIDSRLNLKSVLATAMGTLRDTDDVLFMSNHNETMDNESFVMRHDSFDIVEYMVRKIDVFHTKRSHW